VHDLKKLGKKMNRPQDNPGSATQDNPGSATQDNPGSATGIFMT